MGDMKSFFRERLEDQRDVLENRYHVKKIGFFGSYARGEEKADSDLDVLVEFSAPIGFFEFIRLENFLGELLGKKIDLVSRNALKPAIKEDILQETIYV